MILAIIFAAVLVAILFGFFGAYYAEKDDGNDHRLDQ